MEGSIAVLQPVQVRCQIRQQLNLLRPPRQRLRAEPLANRQQRLRQRMPPLLPRRVGPQQVRQGVPAQRPLAAFKMEIGEQRQLLLGAETDRRAPAINQLGRSENTKSEVSRHDAPKEARRGQRGDPTSTANQHVVPEGLMELQRRDYGRSDGAESTGANVSPAARAGK